MKALDTIARLEKDAAFAIWRNGHPDAYLAHVFYMKQQQGEDWQVGYYDKASDRITTFVLGETVQQNPESEVFKKGGAVERLDMAAVRLDVPDALDAAIGFQRAEYPTELPGQAIVILQRLPLGQVYNITLITLAFKSLNIKLDAATAKVLRHELISFMDFGSALPK
ncbi:hypothetical protein JXB02_00785 [Candidatus Woesearchaeota archaeon]|nr:hypothetical protein [Candidatus Woesearchaeota archaeon]